MTKSMTNVSLQAVALMFVLLGAYLCTLPLQAQAQGKPEVTGQDRAASVGSRANSASSADADATSTGEEKERGPGRGLERAAEAGNKPEEIRNQLRYILILISQLQDAVDGRGIGRELSEFIANGRALPDDGSDDDSDISDADFTATLVASDEILVENDASTTDDNVGEFDLDLAVTASSSDLMIPMGVAMESGSTTGVVYSIRNASGTVVTTGTTSAEMTSTATTSGDMYEVAAGETETFTVSVEFDPEVEGEYYVQLESIRVDGEVYSLTPAEDFDSDPLSI